MRIEKSNTIVKCDIPGCVNFASHRITDSGIDERNQINICDECMKDMHLLLSKILIPKSPENLVKKACKRKLGMTIKEKNK